MKLDKQSKSYGRITEEEKLLQEKYALLRKQKEMLQYQSRVILGVEEQPGKKPLNSEHAKEWAKKLISSGEIFLPAQTNVTKTSFKRPSKFPRRN